MNSRWNPFPLAAIATESWRMDDSIQTSTLKEARQIAVRYASVDDEYHASVPGGCVVITGDYGTGKTHLQLEILGCVSARNPDATTLYLDSMATAFLQLYCERLLPRLRNSGVLEQGVERFKRELSRELVGRSQLMSTAVETGSLTAIGLDRSIADEFLNAHLEKHVGDREAATALSLMSVKGFDEPVWQWLAGGTPDISLRERGIESIIDSDEIALRMVGVIARLMTAYDGRFVLCIDETEKFLGFGPSDAIRKTTADALKSMVNAFIDCGALLVISGLKEVLHILPRDLKQRVGWFLEAAAPSSAELRDFVESRLARLPETASFNSDAIIFANSLSDGNMRRLMLLLHRSYELASVESGAVTRALVARVAMEYSAHISTQSIATVVAEAAVMAGLAVVQGGDGATVMSQVVAESVDGIVFTFIVSEPLLDRAQISRLRKRISSVEKSSPPDSNNRTMLRVLVLRGLSDPQLRSEAAKLFSRVFEASERSLQVDLVSFMTLESERARRREVTAVAETESALLDTITEVKKQNANIQRMLHDLISTQTSPVDVRAASEAGLRRVFSLLADTSPASQMFPEASETISEVRSKLNVLLRATLLRGHAESRIGLESLCLHSPVLGLYAALWLVEELLHSMALPSTKYAYSVEELPGAAYRLLSMHDVSRLKSDPEVPVLESRLLRDVASEVADAIVRDGRRATENRPWPR